MATETIIIRPIASYNAEGISTDNYLKVNEELADDDSTYIEVASADEVFDSLKFSHNCDGYNIISAKVVTRYYRFGGGDTVTLEIKEDNNSLETLSFATPGLLEEEYIWRTVFVDITNINDIAEALTSGNLMLSYVWTQTGKSTYLRITQSYIELEVEFLKLIQFKQDDEWVQERCKIFKKGSNGWEEGDISDFYNQNLLVEERYILPDYLTDFYAISNNDGTFTLTEWKGTMNGISSKELNIPDSSAIYL